MLSSECCLAASTPALLLVAFIDGASVKIPTEWNPAGVDRLSHA